MKLVAEGREAEAQKVLMAVNGNLEASYSEEFTQAKEDFVGTLTQFRTAQYYQACMQVSMTQPQMMVMGRGQQEAQQQTSKSAQMEIMGRCTVKLHESFSVDQCATFLKFRERLVKFGASKYIDAAITARVGEQMVAAKLKEAEAEPEPEMGWAEWINSSLDTVGPTLGETLDYVASSVSDVLGYDDEEATAARMAAEAIATSTSRMLACDGSPIEFEEGAFGARTASLADVEAVRAEPPMADGPITNAAAVKGKVAVVVRGGASFAEKAQAVQAAGAIGMICANTEDVLGRLVGQAPDVTIPCVCIKSSDLDRFGSETRVSLKYASNPLEAGAAAP